jgi:hypothetical protein
MIGLLRERITTADDPTTYSQRRDNPDMNFVRRAPLPENRNHGPESRIYKPKPLEYSFSLYE